MKNSLLTKQEEVTPEMEQNWKWLEEGLAYEGLLSCGVAEDVAMADLDAALIAERCELGSYDTERAGALAEAGLV